MRSIKRIAAKTRETLNHPGQVLFYCAVFFFMTLSLNGVPLRLWGLHRDMDRYQAEILKNHKDIEELEKKLAQASDPSFIERQARDRLDLASENDLIFVFPTQ